jgi:hypothetical protein
MYRIIGRMGPLNTYPALISAFTEEAHRCAY